MALGRHSRNQPSSGLYKKHMERKHVILNAVKDLGPAIQVVLECNNEILPLRLRMT